MWWLVFHDNCTFNYKLKKNLCFLFFGQTHINRFQPCVTLCFLHHLPVLFDLLKHIHIYILYIHQRIDLRFYCGSVCLSLVHIVCFTDIFTSLHLNHDTSPQPTRSISTNTLTKFNCFHSVRWCLFTLATTIDIACFTIYLCLHLYYWTWTRYFEQKVLLCFYLNGNLLRKKKYIKM